MGTTTAYAADIVKYERDENGDLIVYGKATGPDLDLDGQICDSKWLKSAMPSWMEFGNVREMHQPIAAGIGLELEEQGTDWMLRSKCVDPNTARKIEKGVLKGYSVGIKNPQVTKDAGAPGGRIVGGSIVEVSYVDRPCNPTAKMTICKGASASQMLTVEAPADPSPLQPDAQKRDYSTAQREQMAKDGEAQPDGSWPIKTAQDVTDAVRSIGRSQDPTKDKAWIKRRAAAIGASDRIPESWKLPAADASKTTTATGADESGDPVKDDGRDATPPVIAADPGEDAPDTAAESAEKALGRGVGRTISAGLKALKLRSGQPLITKAAPAEDIASAEACMSAIGALIEQEAQGLIAGEQCEAPQISCLLRAYEALQYFCYMEAQEPTEDEAPSMVTVELDAQPDITKAAPAQPDADSTKSTDGAEVSALRKRVEDLSDKLTKALSMPVPGGPVLTRTPSDIASADNRADKLATAARFERMASEWQASDPKTAEGYRKMAAELRA